MSVKFNTVRNGSRLAIIASIIVINISVFWQVLPDQFYSFGEIMAVFYLAGCAITLLLFLGFPRMRRSDLAELAILAGALAMIAKFALSHEIDTLALAGWSAGALTMVVATHVERVRSMTRRCPDEVFSISYDDDRRATRKPSLLAPPATPGKFIQQGAR